jgi:hypothetical protein
MERGTVSSRVALLLRSAEVKPLLQRFVQLLLNFSLFFLYQDTEGPAFGLVRIFFLSSPIVMTAISLPRLIDHAE